MNRKQFLRRGMLFSLAAAGLPPLSHALQTKKKDDEYKKTIKPAGGGEQVYRTRFSEEKITSPETQDDIRIMVEVTHYTGYSFAADAEAGARSGRYSLQRIGAPITEEGYTVIKWKVLSKIDGQDVMKGSFQKTVVMKLRSKRHLILEFSDKQSIQLNYENPDESAYDDCFLTTACTAARGLPDDCKELATLRELRDTHMKPRADGAALIEEYYRIAPCIVRQVNTCSNKGEIWNLVYEDMVAPVVALTLARRMDEAVSHYAEYTDWMRMAFGAEGS